MVWFKVDDSFHSHPKVLAAEPAALGLWVVAGAWSSANLTDGFVSDRALSRLLPGAAELAERLVACGLWRRAKGGYRFHDWDEYNPSSTDVKKERDAARERMRALRAKRRAAAHDVNCSGEHVANVRENFGRSSQPRPDPTRSSPDGELQDTPPAPPDPLRGNKTAEKTARGSRLPDDFVVTPDMAAWAGEKAPSCGMPDHEEFCDYWHSVPGAKGRKLDWEATWRNWMRRNHERRSANRPQSNGSIVPTNGRASTLNGTDAKVAGWLALAAESEAKETHR